MTACEMYRVIQPFSHLYQRGLVAQWVPHSQIERVDTDDFDVIVLARVVVEKEKDRDDFFAAVGRSHQAVVFETDDDLATIPDTNPFQLKPQQVLSLQDMIRRCHLVTVSVPHLAERLRVLNPHVVTLPNTIDPDLWSFTKHIKTYRKVPGLTVGVHGGNSHVKDWEILADVWGELARRYPEVNFVVAGYHPPYLDAAVPTDRLFKLQWCPIEYYPYMVSQIDINCCPLIDDVFNRSKCVVGDTLVSTCRGLIPIRELVPHRGEDTVVPFRDQVWTPDGLRATSHAYYGGEQETIRVRTRDGFEIEGTPSHRVQGTDGGWISLGDMSVGSRLRLVPPKLGEEPIHVPFNPWQERQKSRVSHDLPSLPIVTIDGNWARMFGYVLGDGHVGKNVIRVTCDLRDQDVLEDVLATFRVLGISSSIRPRPADERKCQDVQACSASLGRFLERIGFTTEGRKHFQVPWVILRSPPAIVREFLRALFETDGTVSATGTFVSYCTKSKLLARQVQTLLAAFGIVSRVSASPSTTYRRDYYNVHLRRAAADLFEERIGFIGQRKRDKLRVVTGRGHSNAYRPQVWEDVVIAISRERAEVFDLTVPGPDSFLGDSFVQHNSPIKFLESSMCRAATVASPTVYGDAIRHGVTGFIARGPDEWLAYLSRLIESPGLRRKVGEDARGDVLRHLNIHELAPRWMQAYREAWNRTREDRHGTRPRHEDSPGPSA